MAQNRRSSCIIETKRDILEIILCLVASFRASNYTGRFPPLITNFRKCFFQFRSQSALNLSAETMLETTLFPVWLKLHGVQPASLQVLRLGSTAGIEGISAWDAPEVRTSSRVGPAHVLTSVSGWIWNANGIYGFPWDKSVLFIPILRVNQYQILSPFSSFSGDLSCSFFVSPLWLPPRAHFCV